ncbi:MAG TPA: wax ester/triacylglycerol synthase family O-acyltransferase [Acidimicrobiia bacterium]
MGEVYERLSALEASYLATESPEAPLHVGSLVFFDGAAFVDADGRFRLAEVRAHVAGRLDRIPGFRRRLMNVPLGRPVWVDDPSFDIRHHVRHRQLRPPGTFDQLVALTVRLQMQPLERDRPLWELWFVSGLADGRVAVVEKIHHALVDGVSGVDVAAAIVDLSPEVAPAEPPVWTPRPAPSPASVLAAQAASGLVGTARTLGSVVRHPARTAAKVATLADAVRTLARPDTIAPGSSLNARRLGRRRSLELVDVSLADVQAIRHALGGTVNDVVLAAVTGGLRRLLQHRGDDVDGRALRALVPVSIRSDDEHFRLGNRVAAMFAPLPVGDGDTVDRLRTIRTATREVKDHHQSAATKLFLQAADHTPAVMLGPLSRFGVEHQPFINVIVTNVPGLQRPVYLMGAAMLEAYPIVPLAGSLVVSIGVVSYNGQLGLGLYGDADACPDLDVLARGIEHEFRVLVQAARLENGSADAASSA